MDLPKCQKCNNGTLIPLSDYGQEGSSLLFKAWVCTNPECGFSLRVDKVLQVLGALELAPLIVPAELLRMLR